MLSLALPQRLAAETSCCSRTVNMGGCPILLGDDPTSTIKAGTSKDSACTVLPIRAIAMASSLTKSSYLEVNLPVHRCTQPQQVERHFDSCRSQELWPSKP